MVAAQNFLHPRTYLDHFCTIAPVGLFGLGAVDQSRRLLAAGCRTTKKLLCLLNGQNNVQRVRMTATQEMTEASREEPYFDIGARMKAMRLAAGLSQRQLAQRANVPHAQISNVEKNKVSPSIATLRKILNGLSVSMADFFEPERQFARGPFFRQDELVDLTSKVAMNAIGEGTGRIVLRQIGNAREYNLQILHEVYEPGADTGATFLQHSSSEGGYVVEGELEVTVGEHVRRLKAGEAYLFDSRIPHRFRNISSTHTVVISACTPPYL